MAEFKELGRIPCTVRLTETEAVVLCAKGASWHRSCHVKFNNSKLERARKRSLQDDEEGASASERTKRFHTDKTLCIFCLTGGSLHNFCTFDADRNVRLMATDLADEALLARIAGGDLMAIEAKYHRNCLVNLHNRWRSSQRSKKSSTNIDGKMDESRAFIELVEYIDQESSRGTHMFRLHDLHELYEEADIRMIVHLFHALKCGCKLVQIRTVDTDVIVFFLACSI